MLTKKIKNNTGSTKTYSGQEIAPAAYYEIQVYEELVWVNDTTLQTDITAGDAVVNNGTTDLNATDGLAYLTALNTDCIKAVEVDDAAKADGKGLIYKSATGKLEYEAIGTGNIDGGKSDSNYGGIDNIDGGGA